MSVHKCVKEPVYRGGVFVREGTCPRRASVRGHLLGGTCPGFTYPGFTCPGTSHNGPDTVKYTVRRIVTQVTSVKKRSTIVCALQSSPSYVCDSTRSYTEQVHNITLLTALLSPP